MDLGIAVDKRQPLDKPGWHLERSVSVGHIISTITVIVSLLSWASTVETRLALNTQSTANLAYSVKKGEENTTEMRREIRSDFSSVHDKLDRLRVERR